MLQWRVHGIHELKTLRIQDTHKRVHDIQRMEIKKKNNPESIELQDIRSRTRYGPDETPTQQTTQSECPHSTYLDVLSVAQTMGLFAETVKVDIGGAIIIVMVISWTFSKIKT